MPLVVQADQMLKEMNSAQHTDYDADGLPLLLLQVSLAFLHKVNSSLDFSHYS